MVSSFRWRSWEHGLAPVFPEWVQGCPSRFAEKAVGGVIAYEGHILPTTDH